MNTKLVDSLVSIIESLTPEEKHLLEEKLKQISRHDKILTEEQKLLTLKEKVLTRRGGKPFDPPLDFYIQSARNERISQQDELLNMGLTQE